MTTDQDFEQIVAQLHPGRDDWHVEDFDDMAVQFGVSADGRGIVMFILDADELVLLEDLFEALGQSQNPFQALHFAAHLTQFANLIVRGLRPYYGWIRDMPMVEELS